ncbi:MAG: hypothetical protein HOU81_20260 [Hamadaea sp.]|uniref:hypothetical protein n=1 Tax=Hamadaea sp. TaxID=2024425 RepID=UPI00183047B0|nr:hypothetical protein [Hamadaea sp.]NUR73158.1 hypothetical protein [Hamadaea sp.]NUT18476.1 hypothetical protein [Hamadaea sp.]
MRITAALLTFLLATLIPAAAYADPGEMSVACIVNDKRVSELSGLVVTSSGYIAINDSNWDASAIRIFYLDKKCKLTKSVGYPTAARDPEDVALAKDGTLWVADIGDNYNAPVRRKTIAVWKLSPGAKSPVIYRLAYPDGPHDAETLLLAADGTPIIVTKELTGRSEIFVPTGPLVAKSADGVLLKRVGSVRLPDSQTPNFLDSIGRRLVTGGAVSPDGRHVVLRTYADAFEWDIVDGDIVKTLTDEEPRVTPLPDEQQGEAIAYAPDGSAFVTACDEPTGPTTLRRYVPAARPSPSPSPDAADPADPAASEQELAGDAGEPGNRLMFAVGITGLVLVALGIAGLALRRLKGQPRA